MCRVIKSVRVRVCVCVCVSVCLCVSVSVSGWATAVKIEKQHLEAWHRDTVCDSAWTSSPICLKYLKLKLVLFHAFNSI